MGISRMQNVLDMCNIYVLRQGQSWPWLRVGTSMPVQQALSAGCLSAVSPQVLGPEARLPGLPAPQAQQQAPGQGQELPQRRPQQACPSHCFPGLQSWHDPHCPRGGQTWIQYVLMFLLEQEVVLIRNGDTWALQQQLWALALA